MRRFGTQARRDWKRAGRKDCAQPLLARRCCCVWSRRFLGTEFTGSLDVLHLTQQKWDTISNVSRVLRQSRARRRTAAACSRLAVNKIAERFASEHHCEQHRHVARRVNERNAGQTIAIAVSSLVSAIYWVFDHEHVRRHSAPHVPGDARHMRKCRRIARSICTARTVGGARRWRSCARRSAGAVVADDCRRRDQDVFVLSSSASFWRKTRR